MPLELPSPVDSAASRIALAEADSEIAKISVVLIEPDGSIRQRVSEWLNASLQHRCIANCESGEAGLRDALKYRPDVVLMEIDLPRMTGLTCIAQLKLDLPDIRVITFTGRNDHATIFGALRAGASGYLLKNAGQEEILDAITHAKGGGAPIAPEVIRLMVRAFQVAPRSAPVLPKVSPRESEVLQLLSQGLPTKQIAAHLGISYETACVHLRRLYGKLKVRSRTEAVIKNLEAKSALLAPFPEFSAREL